MYTVNGYVKYLQNFLVKEIQLSWSVNVGSRTHLLFSSVHSAPFQSQSLGKGMLCLRQPRFSQVAALLSV